MDKSTILQIYHNYLHNACTPAEAEQLIDWLSQSSNAEVAELLISSTFNEPVTMEAVGGLKEKLQENLQQIQVRIQNQPQKVIGKRVFLLAKYAAAACLLFFVGNGMYQYFSSNQLSNTVETRTRTIIKDALPGGEKAILTLANGERIVLDNAGNGALTQQGGIKVIKLNGQLSYKNSNGMVQMVYNTISTPKGGQYQLELADGSKVWLNAASSLRFPNVFIGNKREVELTGEGYFEVAKNNKQPFTVKFNNTSVNVVGTHFNIDTYKDEGEDKVTLLEGSVIVAKLKNTTMLKPGQQAKIGTASIGLNNSPDLESVMAWKNGSFHFDKTPLKHILLQAARWYNIEIEFGGKASTRVFSGDISRNVNLSQLLKILELSNVQFQFDGKQLVVK